MPASSGSRESPDVKKRQAMPLFGNAAGLQLFEPRSLRGHCARLASGIVDGLPAAGGCRLQRT